MNLKAKLAWAGIAWVAAGVAAGAWAADVNPAPPVIPDFTFNLTDYGAVGDGKALNTQAFKNGIAAMASAGGGHLVVPKGVYLTMPFALTSHMDLHLEEGSVIQFPSDLSMYGLPADLTHMTRADMAAFGKRVPALITGDKLSDVAITGSGIIDGGGKPWWKLVFKRPVGGVGAPFGGSGAAVGEAGTAVGGAGAAPHTLLGDARPRLIVITNSQRLHFQGVTLQNSPRYNLAPSLCSDILVEGVTIFAPGKPGNAPANTFGDAPNTDAIDPIACHDVLIRDCNLSVGDDNVAIKAIDGPCFNIVVQNCHCGTGHGISIGSETYQGIHDVTVRDCTFNNTANAIRIKSARDRGNDLYGFSFSNITMNNVTTALTINMYYMDKFAARNRETMPVTKHTPVLHDVRIENVTATNVGTAGDITGLPEMAVKDITLTNVKISANKGMTVSDAKQIVFKNVQITAKQGKAITENFAQVDSTN